MKWATKYSVRSSIFSKKNRINCKLKLLVVVFRNERVKYEKLKIMLHVESSLSPSSR